VAHTKSCLLLSTVRYRFQYRYRVKISHKLEPIVPHTTVGTIAWGRDSTTRTGCLRRYMFHETWSSRSASVVPPMACRSRLSSTWQQYKRPTRCQTYSQVGPEILWLLSHCDLAGLRDSLGVAGIPSRRHAHGAGGRGTSHVTQKGLTHQNGSHKCEGHHFSLTHSPRPRSRLTHRPCPPLPPGPPL
jgi:hypothetical protein